MRNNAPPHLRSASSFIAIGAAPVDVVRASVDTSATCEDVATGWGLGAGTFSGDSTLVETTDWRETGFSSLIGNAGARAAFSSSRATCVLRCELAKPSTIIAIKMAAGIKQKIRKTTRIPPVADRFAKKNTLGSMHWIWASFCTSRPLNQNHIFNDTEDIQRTRSSWPRLPLLSSENEPKSYGYRATKMRMGYHVQLMTDPGGNAL